MKKDEKIIHAFQAIDRVTILTDKGNLYTLENYPHKHWKQIVILDEPTGSSPSGSDKKLGGH